MPTGWWTQWARSWVTPSVIKCDLITFAYVNRRYDRLAVHSAKYHSVASLFDHKENLVACRTFCYCTVTQTLYFDFVFFFFLQLKLIDETQLNPNKAAFATCIWKKSLSGIGIKRVLNWIIHFKVCLQVKKKKLYKAFCGSRGCCVKSGVSVGWCWRLQVWKMQKNIWGCGEKSELTRPLQPTPHLFLRTGARVALIKHSN